jgi:hypothetical protein
VALVAVFVVGRDEAESGANFRSAKLLSLFHVDDDVPPCRIGELPCVANWGRYG